MVRPRSPCRWGKTFYALFFQGNKAYSNAKKCLRGVCCVTFNNLDSVFSNYRETIFCLSLFLSLYPLSFSSLSLSLLSLPLPSLSLFSLSSLSLPLFSCYISLSPSFPLSLSLSLSLSLPLYLSLCLSFSDWVSIIEEGILYLSPSLSLSLSVTESGEIKHLFS